MGLTIDVLGLVARKGADGELAVGRFGGAVTAGKIVDDQTKDRVARGLFDEPLESGDHLDLVTVDCR